jgi:hypothetical protein
MYALELSEHLVATQRQFNRMMNVVQVIAAPHVDERTLDHARAEELCFPVSDVTLQFTDAKELRRSPTP